MQTLDLKSAIEKVKIFKILNLPSTDSLHGFELDEKETVETQFGWIFSFKFDGSPDPVYPSGGRLIVDKFTGDITPIYSGETVSSLAVGHETKGKRYSISSSSETKEKAAAISKITGKAPKDALEHARKAHLFTGSWPEIDCARIVLEYLGLAIEVVPANHSETNSIPESVAKLQFYYHSPDLADGSGKSKLKVFDPFVDKGTIENLEFHLKNN